MPKPNAYLSKLKAEKEAELRLQRKFTMQWCADAATFAANDVFQRRGEKLVEFLETFFRYSEEIATLTLADAKDDKTLEYTKAKLDTRLQELLGDAFQPWEERYDFVNLEEKKV